ncbi:MAG: hypothetical protein HY925_14555 [Elusimicrobia bacterium]|nr:hypothetical protein [Elusimicrobiota bacterium]
MLLLAVLSAHMAAACDERVRYALSPEVVGSTASLRVDVWFKGSPDGTTRLKSPEDGRDSAVIEDVRVDKPAKLEREGERRVVRHKPSAEVHLRYRVRSQDGDNDTHDVAGLIRKDYVHLVGAHAFIVPDLEGESVFELEWKAPGWTSADSFGAGGLTREVCTGADTFRHALYAAGKGLRLTELDVRGKPVWLATAGTWTFSDEKLGGALKGIFEAERAFWNDDDFPYYLVSLAPRTGSGWHGSAFTNSFGLWAKPDVELDADLLETFAHELFHAWNGGKIRKDDLEARMYWFSEGFTDYFTRLLLLRSGVFSLEDYVANVNKRLDAYHSSPSREEPNERIAKDFWNDMDVQYLPYRRGDVLALRWNAEIKRASKGRSSLDDAMHALLKASAEKGTQASPDSIRELFSPFSPAVSRDLDAVAEKGGLVEVPPDALGPCARMTLETPVAYELGFDYDGSWKDKVVRGVVKGSAAWKAGLRDGATLAGIDMVHGDPGREARFWIAEKGGKTKIAYLPARTIPGPKRPRFVLDEKRAQRDRARCLAWFGAKP